MVYIIIIINSKKNVKVTKLDDVGADACQPDVHSCKRILAYLPNRLLELLLRYTYQASVQH